MRARLLFAAVLLISLQATHVMAQPTPALGPRLGSTQGPDEFYLGAHLETGVRVGTGRFAPSLDLGIGDVDHAVFNADLRWYLLRIPETGMQIYGSAGPSLPLSPDTDLGLSLTAGLHIPMRGGRRYNVELRFGFGDVPDLKIGAGILFDF